MNRRDLIAAGSAAVLNACASSLQLPPHAPVAVPFTAGRLGAVYLPVAVNGVAGMALLDNGWWRSGLDRTYAHARGLIRNKVRREVARGVSLTVAGFEWRVDAGVEDLSALDAGEGVPGVIAVIGAEFFARHVVEIDFIGQRVVIHHPEGFVAPAGFTQIALTSPRKAGETRFPARVEGGAGFDLILDLGGGHDGVFFKPGALSDRLLKGRPSVPLDNIGAFRGGEAKLFPKARLFSVRDLTFAGFTLTDVPAGIGDRYIAPRADANAGISVIRRFDIIFDTASRRLWLRPNTRFAEPFHYNLVGSIKWALGPRPESLRVMDVQPGSPAERAGLKIGDVAVRFWSVPATPANLQELQQRPLKAGDVIEVELQDGRILRIVAARFY